MPMDTALACASSRRGSRACLPTSSSPNEPVWSRKPGVPARGACLAVHPFSRCIASFASRPWTTWIGTRHDRAGAHARPADAIDLARLVQSNRPGGGIGVATAGANGRTARPDCSNQTCKNADRMVLLGLHMWAHAQRKPLHDGGSGIARGPPILDHRVWSP